MACRMEEVCSVRHLKLDFSGSANINDSVFSALTNTQPFRGARVCLLELRLSGCYHITPRLLADLASIGTLCHLQVLSLLQGFVARWCLICFTYSIPKCRVCHDCSSLMRHHPLSWPKEPSILQFSIAIQSIQWQAGCGRCFL